jgi:hypothetical protein
MTEFEYVQRWLMLNRGMDWAEAAFEAARFLAKLKLGTLDQYEDIID